VKKVLLAIAGGLLGGGAVVLFLASRHAKDLERRGEALRNPLESEARELAESAARAEAERTLGVTYGITEARIRTLEQHARRLGIN